MEQLCEQQTTNSSNQSSVKDSQVPERWGGGSSQTHYWTHIHKLPTSPTEECQEPYTFKYILLNCNFQQTRIKLYKPDNSKDLFENINSSNIIDFIKEIAFYRKI